MSAVEHPRFPNPTIIEAVAEVHFQLSTEQDWKLGDFFQRIQPDYPEIEPILNIGVQIGFSPQGIEQAIPVNKRFRFKHRSRPLVLQLAENVFTVNVLPPYSGWEDMSIEVQTAWQQFLAALVGPATVSKVALRYINRIPLESDRQSPEHWLNANDYLPRAVLRSEPVFFSRTEVRNAEDLCIVMLGYQPPESAGGYGPHGAIIFDIDRSVERTISPREDALMQELHAMHEHVWHVFDSARSDNLNRLLERNPR